MTARSHGRLIAVEIDAGSLAARPTGGRSFIDEERAVAVHDLLAENRFDLAGHEGGDFRLTLSLADARLVLAVADAGGERAARHILSLTPFRRIVKDYFLVCDAYYAAVRGSNRARIEAIDVGRRGLHNDGAELLQERLAGKIVVDFPTARRLFTLICALHWKG